MKLFIFNGFYIVRAKTKEEAIKKVTPYLTPNYHQWYTKPNSESPREQGHLVVTEYDFTNDVAIVEKLKNTNVLV